MDFVYCGRWTTADIWEFQMNLKETLLKKLEERNADLTKLESALTSMEIEEERKACGTAIEKIKAEIEETTNALNDETRKESEALEKAMDNARQEDARKGEAKMDYRHAFMDYVIRGIAIPEEFRANANTTTTDIGVAIPENLVNEIFEKFEEVGTLYNLVTKTNYPVGQTIPKDGVKPVATWVAEGATSDKQKKTLDGSFTFAHYKLRCEISVSEESSKMAIEAFERLFIKQVSTAMVRAIEGAIVSGDGTSMPSGILITEGASKVEVANTGLKYSDLIAMESAVRSDKEATAKWFMAKKTFMAALAMVDSNGQPIARVNYGINGKPERVLLGREVVLYTPVAGSKLGVYGADTASGTIVAFIADMADYVLNFNYDLGVSSKVDWDTENHLTKAVLACDGKFVEDGDALVEMVIGA